MDRRAFLKSVPLNFMRGVKTLLAYKSEPSRRLAVLDIARCLAWGEGSCQLCYIRCPLRDEAMLLEGSKPMVVASACDGCGVCAEVCRTVNDMGAIQLVDAPPSPSQRHLAQG